MRDSLHEVESVEIFCREVFNNECVVNVLRIFSDIVSRYGATVFARWACQKVRGGRSVNYELRIYFKSPKVTSTQIAREVCEELRRLGYGAYVRSRDTFITVRRGKEELAVILYKLGILRELIPDKAPVKVRESIEKELRKIEQGYIICEIPEQELEKFYKKFIEYVNEKFKKLLQKYENEKKVIEELKEEFGNLYIKLPITIDEIRRRIRENIDYITWLTICDGITSIIVENNVDILEYGTTRHELPTTITKALGFIKLKITGKDNKTGKLHIVATCSNYIAQELFKQEIPEIDYIIRRIRQILGLAKSILASYLKSRGVEIQGGKVKDINATLRAMYIKGEINFEEIDALAEQSKDLISTYLNDEIKALAGEFDGDGVVIKRGEDDYGVGIALAPYTVKGFASLLLLKYLEAKKLIKINGFQNEKLVVTMWLSPKTRYALSILMQHSVRRGRIGILNERITTHMIEKSIVDPRMVIDAIKEVIAFTKSLGVSIRGKIGIWKSRGERRLIVYLKFSKNNQYSNRDIKLAKIADEVVKILRNHGLGARRRTKSALVEVTKGKIELLYILLKLGLIDKDVIATLKDLQGQLLRILMARFEELKSRDNEIERLLSDIDVK